MLGDTRACQPVKIREGENLGLSPMKALSFALLYAVLVLLRTLLFAEYSRMSALSRSVLGSYTMVEVLRLPR
jgi:hypothetical protein